jgi:hypothetical protein
MLWTIFVILLVLWAVGMAEVHARRVHPSPPIAIAVVLIRVIQGRQPV